MQERLHVSHLCKHDVDPLNQQLVRQMDLLKQLDLHAHFWKMRFFFFFFLSSRLNLCLSYAFEKLSDFVRQEGKSKRGVPLSIRLASARPQLTRRGVKSLSESDDDGVAPRSRSGCVVYSFVALPEIPASV